MSALAMEAVSMESLITKACGARSLTEFAKSCGISTMHVSRIRSGIAKPSRKMCIKLGSDPYVREMGMTSEDFLRAAGYEDEEEIESTTSFEQMLNESLELLTTGFIAKKLSGKKIKFTINTPSTQSDADFTFEIMGDDVKVWNVCTSKIANLQGQDLSRVQKYYLMGKLITFKPEAHVQYTLVVNNDELYQWICSEAEALNILANVTLVLLDHKQMSIMKETQLGPGDSTYISLLEKATIK